MYVCIQEYVRTYVHILYIRMYVCTYVCTFTYKQKHNTYICTYVHTHTYYNHLLLPKHFPTHLILVLLTPP